MVVSHPPLDVYLIHEARSGNAEEFDGVVSGPSYSADSRKVAFVVRKGMELWSKVMDVK